MISEAKTVAEYLETVPDNRKEALTKLRNLCLEILTGCEETMAYQLPAYKKDGDIVAGFASQTSSITTSCSTTNTCSKASITEKAASVFRTQTKSISN